MGEQGFQELQYKGKPLVRDVAATTSVAYYQHIYRTNFSGGYKSHACLQFSVWCWKQAREKPLDAIRYLTGRLK